MEVSTESFGPLFVEETADYDSSTEVNRGTWYISTAGRRDARIVPMVLRSISPQEHGVQLKTASRSSWALAVAW
jgi:hypothetical protein